jgi:hypothetical protein
MQENCHRCGGELAGDTAFCPHCGAPQLTLALEQQSVEAGGERADGAASTGAAPPSMPRAVDWRVAMRYALLVALVGAALRVAAAEVNALFAAALLWMVSASVITLGLYQKRLPAARIDAGIGARIGVVAGLFLALAVGISMTGWRLAERYMLHGMGSIDAQMLALMQQVMKQMQQQAAAQQSPLPAWLPALWNSPEAPAAMTLGGYAMVAVVLIAVSAMSGAFGGLLRARRR